LTNSKHKALSTKQIQIIKFKIQNIMTAFKYLDFER